MGISRASIRIRFSSPASVTWRIARATESGSNSTPTSSVAGKRVATAMSHLPPPQATSRTRLPAASWPARSGSSASPSWKKTAMSWTVTASIARWNRGGRSSIGRPVLKKSGRPGVVEARDDGDDELAAEILRPGLVEQDRRGGVVHPHPRAVVLEELARVGRPDPGLDGFRRAFGGGGELGGRDALALGGMDQREQAELEAEVDHPALVEAAEALGEVVEPVVGRHRRPIVAWGGGSRTGRPADTETPPRSGRRSGGRVGAPIWAIGAPGGLLDAEYGPPSGDFGRVGRIRAGPVAVTPATGTSPSPGAADRQPYDACERSTWPGWCQPGSSRDR